MNNKQTDKYIAYKKLMFMRDFFMFYNIVILCIFYLVFEFFNVPTYITGVIIVIELFVVFFIFMSKNICPWCDHPFFIYGKDGVADGTTLLNKKCLNFGQPKDDSSIE